MTTSNQQRYSLGWIALLSLISAFSALSTDMYLPALPDMAAQYQVSTHALGNTLGAYFLGLAFGQLIYGPLSDRFGRRPPLFFGLIIYIIASFCCAIAASHGEFLIYRVLQALGGCAGVVIARAAIRDALSLKESAQALSTMMIVMSLAPIIAPSMGAVLIGYFAWTSIFYFLTLIGMVTLALVHLFFKETLVPEKRVNVSVVSTLKSYGGLLLDRRFSIPLLSGSLFYSLIYAYLAMSPDIFINIIGMSESNFSLVFGAMAFSLMIFSFVNNRLLKRFPLKSLLLVGCLIQTIGVVIVSLCALPAEIPVFTLLLGIFIVIGGLGFTGPNVVAMVMQSQSQNIGLASAMVGSVQFLYGFIVTSICAALPFSSLMNMIVMMVMCLCLAAFIQVLGKLLPQAAEQITSS